jgi:hypothetical protein
MDLVPFAMAPSGPQAIATNSLCDKFLINGSIPEFCRIPFLAMDWPKVKRLTVYEN